MQIAFATTVRFCATCAVEGPFEQPECIDDHGVDCPEWVCVGCGDALVVGFLDVPSEATPDAARHVA